MTSGRASLWLGRVAMVLVFLSVAMSLSVVFLRPFLPGGQLTGYVVVPLFCSCGAMALLGIAGAGMTRRARWLWLLPVAALLVTLALLDAIFGAP